MDQIGSDWIRLDQIGSDWIRLDQMTIEDDFEMMMVINSTYFSILFKREKTHEFKCYLLEKLNSAQF